MIFRKMLFNLLILLMMPLLISFGSSPLIKAQSPQDNTGVLRFVANGEDFVRRGFTSKDGWDITFEEVLVNITAVTAVQSWPPFDPDLNNRYSVQAAATLEDSYLVDLAKGGVSAGPILIDEIEARAGRYNALRWRTVPAAEGELAGYAMRLKGTAEQDGQSIAFTIGLETGYDNRCGAYIGHDRKGILQPGETAEMEMTFHFDHIFGDAELPADDNLNELAPGFAPFASVAENGVIDLDLTTLAETLPKDELQPVLDILPTLGHTGEGHCAYFALGELAFTANGEDFIRQGFTSKDGWDLSFDKVLVNLTGVTAYQANPPYEPDQEIGLTPEYAVSLTDSYVVDLAEGEENAASLLVETVPTRAGRYNALHWQMTPATDGELMGNSILLVGTAEKDDQSINFNIGIDESYSNTCGDFVGDERKGILQPGAAAEVEMTFHFDHIFGDGQLPVNDSLNKLAPGFKPFAAVAEDDSLEVSLSELESLMPEDQYQRLLDILPTLGHTGEGHCLHDQVGSLAFTANGEDFVRQGFTSKDGWNLSFDKVWINLTGVTAYQANPPYDPEQMDADIEAEQVVQLAGEYAVDLAMGEKNVAPIPVGEVIAPAGRYNALSWQIVPATAGEMTGYSLLITGVAEKDDDLLPFTIGIEESYSNLCGEYVGDTRKGILAADDAADLEMTFHFDHIFGNADLSPHDSRNRRAPGFEPFAAVAENGVIETDLAALVDALAPQVYQGLVDTLSTLGHTGEGHCFYGP